MADAIANLRIQTEKVGKAVNDLSDKFPLHYFANLTYYTLPSPVEKRIIRIKNNHKWDLYTYG
ncbi:hypothetical protein ABK046_48875, partial [Streptomyces caeruleatus]